MSHSPICPCCSPGRSAGAGGGLLLLAAIGAAVYSARGAIEHALRVAVVSALVVALVVSVVTAAVVAVRARRQRAHRAEMEALGYDMSYDAIVADIRRATAALEQGPAQPALEQAPPTIRVAAERLPAVEDVR